MIFESFDIPIFGITGNGYSITEVILPIIEVIIKMSIIYIFNNNDNI